MKKLSATIFLAVLAVGSIYGCMFDDGRRGDGARGEGMDRRSEADRPTEAQRDRTERDERRSREKDEERKEDR